MGDDSITIMVVRQGGKIRSIKLRIARLVYLTGGFLLLVCGLGFVIYGYQILYHEQSQLLATSLETLETAIPPIALLSEEDSSEEQESPGDLPADGSGGVIPETTASGDPPHADSEAFSIIDIPDAKYKDSPVAVSNFEVDKIDSAAGGLRVRFHLNNQKREKLIQGYIFMVGVQKGVRDSLYLVYPRGRLASDGTLVNYRVGESYAIMRFKPITGSFYSTREVVAINEVVIYVYASHGALLYRKKFGLMDLAIAR